MRSKPLFLLSALLAVFALLQSSAHAAITFELLASFDYGEGNQVNARGINERGDVAGDFDLGGIASRGFLRYNDGHFSGPLVEPNDTGNFTVLSDINNVKTLCGFYSANGPYHGFLFSHSTFTEIALGPSNTIVSKVNDAGNFCGFIFSPYQGFVSIDGTVSFFSIPGAVITSVNGINNLNQVVGSYVVGSQEFGFRRDADGTLTYPIAISGATATTLFGINDRGVMVGRISSLDHYHAVVLSPEGEFALYDYPGSTYTDFEDINSRRQICGTYVGSAGAFGFIVRARSSTGE